MPPDAPSRRTFLSASGTALGGAWLLGILPDLAVASEAAIRALGSGQPFAVLTEREAADFEAYAARIIPTDDTPGAREAGAVYFADNVLGNVFAEALPMIRDGLAALHGRATATAPGAASFAALDEGAQDRLIAQVQEEDPGFFFFARLLVTLAMVCHPDWGGNRDKVGWRLMGLQDYYAWQPPFGFYDRDEHGAGEDDA